MLLVKPDQHAERRAKRYASASHRIGRPGSIGEGARFLNRQLSNRLFGKTGGLSQLFDFLSLLQYKVGATRESTRQCCSSALVGILLIIGHCDIMSSVALVMRKTRGS